MTQKKVVMYTKVPCPFCVAAKRFLEQKQISFEEIDLTHNLDQLNQIMRQTGWMTVPIILIGNELIGGYTDLKELDEQGLLEKKLLP